MKPLTSCERVNRMMEHRDHDRIPRHESFWQETIVRWQGEGLEGGQESVLALLESDFHGICWLWPEVYPGTEKILSEDAETQVILDGQGKRVRYWKHKSGTPEHLGLECDSREVWEKTFKPALLENSMQLNLKTTAESFQAGRAAGKWTHFAGVEVFEETRSLIGDEIALMAMVEDPEWLVDMAKTFTDVSLQNLDADGRSGHLPDYSGCSPAEPYPFRR